MPRAVSTYRALAEHAKGEMHPEAFVLARAYVAALQVGTSKLAGAPERRHESGNGTRRGGDVQPKGGCQPVPPSGRPCAAPRPLSTLVLDTRISCGGLERYVWNWRNLKGRR